ncbi:BTB/POZ domain-containing protein POB1-like [Pyrus ussuriensis x Pyrus communis]|uniref:BTB/POZ domain-containing protein POB1-like n=1 Tax=Pyrus ussuriensis x Pyrus communis TaxID=2448454 RepID=A0A5N5GDP1_9ROSA|nr:BTB/POZ domain-containing protein POB1-like [Pyrus ussuriensis x Pyrus communis]
MRKANVNLSRPRIVTNSDASPSGLAGESVGSDNEVQDFAFAFNDINFSNQVMLIEIVTYSSEGKLEVVECSAVSCWARNRKRQRAEIKRDNVEDIPVHRVGQVLNCDMPDAEDNVVFENQDDEAGAVSEFPSTVGAIHSFENFVADNFSWNLDCHTVVKVRTLQVSSPILAAKSPFLYKLFSNGMRESEQRQVSLRIHESEEAPLMEVLNFIYSNTLSAMTPTALLDVLKVADKFEVASCMRYCSRSLLKLPMTRESALLYLDLPSGILMADAAKQFLAGHYKEITKFQDEVLSLPLAGTEAVLSSNDLQVASEDSIYDFVAKMISDPLPKTRRTTQSPWPTPWSAHSFSTRLAESLRRS